MQGQSGFFAFLAGVFQFWLTALTNHPPSILDWVVVFGGVLVPLAILGSMLNRR